MIPGAEIILVLRDPETHRRRFDLLKWGLVPHHAPDQSRPHFHARAETIAQLRPFADSFATRRCVLVTKMFHQRRTIGQPKGREFAIGMADNSDLLIAGIWDAWHVRGTKDWIRTFAVVTTAANPVVAAIHDRMPAILRREQLPIWFGEVAASLDEVQELLRPAPAEGMIRWLAKSRRPSGLVVEEEKDRQPDLFAPRR